ncbi:MAG: EcsC family protein [Leptospiraceae bacterium]|nr:EcsC family protein [Leptospiraceae bacterium]
MSDENIFLQALDWIYERALERFGVLDSAYDLAQEYLKENDYDTQKAIDALIQKEALKSGGAGFLTGVGGFASLPVSLPANIVSSLYVQVRMVAAIAHLCNYDLKDEKVKIFIFGCLIGNEFKEVLKNLGIQFGTNLAKNIIKRISSELLKEINSKVGFQLFSKFGSKGVINFSRLVPILGGAIGGGFDYIASKQIGEIAIQVFYKEESSENKEL